MTVTRKAPRLRRRDDVAAVRLGITLGKQVRYGAPDDPYYELRSEAIWNYSIGYPRRLRELCVRAFKRTSEALIEARRSQLTGETLEEAERNFLRAHLLWTESREEREMRLLREEIAELRGSISRSSEALSGAESIEALREAE